MSFPVTVGLAFGDEKVTSTTKIRRLGTRGVLPDGRVFRWALNGGTAIEAGHVVQSGVVIGASVHANGLTIVNATATGVSTITVLMATTNVAADYYADGYLTVDTSPGQGMYVVKSNTVAASAANSEFTLQEKIRTAMTSGTTLVGFRANPYASVIIAPATTLTGALVGVTPVAMAIGAFGWLQTWGHALVNTDSAPIAGQRLVYVGASAGNLDVQSTGSAGTAEAESQSALPTIGIATTAGAGADKYNFIFLTIAP